MTGTQSLSRAQLDTIHNEINRLDGGTDPARWVKTTPLERDGEIIEPSKRVRIGTVVAVTIHQSLQHSDMRKRVHLHRVYENSHVIGLLRDGSIIRSQDAA
jgi:hypothetical protein